MNLQTNGYLNSNKQVAFVLRNSLITGNSGRGLNVAGGSYYVTHSTLLNMKNCIISNNNQIKQSSGGGIFVSSYSYCFVQGSTIINNSSATYGGGIYMGGNGCTLKKCKIINNKTGNYGAGLYGAFTADSCVIADNTLTREAIWVQEFMDQGHLLIASFPTM
jgi:predicted outer membrane repeat protein